MQETEAYATIKKWRCFLEICKYINIKIQNKTIEIKCIYVIKVIKIIYKFHMKILIQNINHSN